MKIKDKFIHMLGGYTEKEYNISKMRMNIAVCERPVVTLKAGYLVNRHDPISETFIRNELTAKLANRMLDEGFIQFVTSSESEYGTSTSMKEVHAYVSVVKLGGAYEQAY